MPIGVDDIANTDERLTEHVDALSQQQSAADTQISDTAQPNGSQSSGEVSENIRNFSDIGIVISDTGHPNVSHPLNTHDMPKHVGEAVNKGTDTQIPILNITVPVSNLNINNAYAYMTDPVGRLAQQQYFSQPPTCILPSKPGQNSVTDTLISQHKPIGQAQNEQISVTVDCAQTLHMNVQAAAAPEIISAFGVISCSTDSVPKFSKIQAISDPV